MAGLIIPRLTPELKLGIKIQISRIKVALKKDAYTGIETKLEISLGIKCTSR
jgi:hypothetical protein